MTDKCTIIMYHFVRELKFTRYPKIKARLLSEFQEQLDYLQENYVIINIEKIIDNIYNNNPFPKNAVLLTFDDGYKEHYDNVFPILEKRNIQGCFFPPVKAISEKKVLNVNKIHFILAVNEEKGTIKDLLNEIFDLLDKFRSMYNLKRNEYYFSKLAKQGRFDPKEIIFIKRLLQKELSEELRGKILNILFKRHINVSEKIFSNELYLNLEQLKCMSRNGMHIGSHGYKHYWMDSIDSSKIEFELEKSIDFLNEIGIPKNRWTFCYPYGAYNNDVLRILKEKKYKLAFTTKPKIAKINKKNSLKLARLDTNNIPIS